MIQELVGAIEKVEKTGVGGEIPLILALALFPSTEQKLVATGWEKPRVLKTRQILRPARMSFLSFLRHLSYTNTLEANAWSDVDFELGYPTLNGPSLPPHITQFIELFARHLESCRASTRAQAHPEKCTYCAGGGV